MQLGQFDPVEYAAARLGTKLPLCATLANDGLGRIVPTSYPVSGSPAVRDRSMMRA